jgi:tetratricopeptide (TPR) repeat protein
MLVVLLLATGCVYFNTFYNAQRIFGQAEKARRKELAEAALRQAEDTVPLSTPTRQLYESVAKKASRVLEKYPQNDRVDDALFMLGRSFYWQQDYLSAVRSFSELEAGFPKSEFVGRARYWRALSLEGQGQYDAARPIYAGLVATGDKTLGPAAGLRRGRAGLSGST